MQLLFYAADGFYVFGDVDAPPVIESTLTNLDGGRVAPDRLARRVRLVPAIALVLLGRWPNSN